MKKQIKGQKIGSILYKCSCECGNIVYYSLADFRRNTSCGCWKKSPNRINNIKKSLECFDGTSIKLLENRKLNSNNTSGFRGVSYNKTKKKWISYIKLKNKNIHLGTFDTKEEAVQSRLKGEEKYYKPIIQKYNANK